MKRPGGNTIGALGEDIVCRYLVQNGFSIREQNYRKKWGELDIVAARNDMLHFIEVKSVSCDTFSGKEVYRPEENVHPKKLERLSRAIQTYILERNIADEQEWQLDVVVVVINSEAKTAKIRYIPDVVL